ncbi:MAG: sugar phosphate nucleotidyltransferase [Bacteroidales bacterium]|nr:sugar phosphate nucleotidyltransferase [Bacteroidales bacterium]MDZ4203718.1 sugar phosphate nucleotidyltransferase [Bacteroidales bacterium]
MPRAMILAAGMGTRLRPLTEDKPKALVKINHKPLIEHVIERLQNFGYHDVIVNLHHRANLLKTFLESKKLNSLNLSFSDETTKLLDTGGGIKKARWFFSDGEPFLVHNCDVISKIPIDRMLNQHMLSGALATLAVSNRHTARPLAFDESNHLKERFKSNEIPQVKGEVLRPLAFSGIYLLDPEIFNFMPDKDVFSIVDVLIEAATSRLVMAYEHDPAIWMDVGSKNNLQKASFFP